MAVEKQSSFIERVVNTPKPGIVYVATRKRTEEIAAALCDKGIKAVYYHAGMKAGDRQQVQTEFMHDQAEVIVAKTAF